MVKDSHLPDSEARTWKHSRNQRQTAKTPEGKKIHTDTKEPKTYPRIMCLMLKAEGKGDNLEQIITHIKNRGIRGE